MTVKGGTLRRGLTYALYRQAGRLRSQIQRTRSLPADVIETTDTYLLVFDAPGVSSEQLEVRYHNGTVRIGVDRFRSRPDGFDLRFAGRSMELDGAVDLPSEAVVDPELATAHLGDAGTVSIELPKEATVETESPESSEASEVPEERDASEIRIDE